LCFVAKAPMTYNAVVRWITSPAQQSNPPQITINPFYAVERRLIDCCFHPEPFPIVKVSVCEEYRCSYTAWSLSSADFTQTRTMFNGTKSSKKNEVISTPSVAATAPVAASVFKVFKQKEFHDSRTCEHPSCTTKFWGLGNRHHCRMCGLSVCTNHCRSEVTLSTASLAVSVVDESKLAGMSNQILASSRNSLPEAIVFRRACVECCRKAKYDGPAVAANAAGFITTGSSKSSGKSVHESSPETKQQDDTIETSETGTEAEADIPHLDLVDIQHDDELKGFASQDSVENDLPVVLEPLSTKEVTIIETEPSDVPIEDPLEKEMAALAKAQQLLEAATVVEVEAEKMAFAAERVVLSMDQTTLSAEESAKSAKASVDEVENHLKAMENYRTRAEKQSTIAHEAFLATSQKVEGVEKNSLASVERVDVADAEHTAERSRIEHELAVVDGKAADLEKMWETDDSSESDRAAQRLTYAQERASLIAQLSVAAGNRERKAVEHLSLARKNAEVSEAYEHAATASAAESSATALQEDVASAEQVLESARRSQSAAEKAKACVQRAAEAKAEVHVAVQSAEAAAANSADAAAAVRAADAECAELGVASTPHDANNADRVLRRSQRYTEAVQRVDVSTVQVIQLSEAAQESAQTASSLSEKVLAALAEGDAAVSSTTKASDDATREAARARAVDTDSIKFAEAALQRSRADASASITAIEQARALSALAEASLAKARDNEAAENAAHTAELATVAAMDLLTRQTVAKIRAAELIAAAQAAEIHVGECATSAQNIAAAVEVTLVSAETDAAIAHAAVASVEEEAVYMESYRARVDELKASATQAKLDAALEANVSEENCAASELRIEAADTELSAERESNALALTGLDVKLADGEAQWEREGLSEHERTAHRVNFAQERADLLGKLSTAETLREKKAAEHVAIVRAHTEVAQAHAQAAVASSAAAKALELQQITHSADHAKSTAHSGQEAAERVKFAAKHAAEAKVEVRVSVVAVQRAVEESAHASALAKVAVAECEDMGAMSPLFDVIPADSVDQRCAEAVKRVDASADRVFHLKETSQQDAQTVTVRCGQAVAARIVGDMTVVRTADIAEQATQEAERAREAQHDCVSFADMTLSRTAHGVRASTRVVSEARSAAVETENAHIAATEAEEARVADEAAEIARIDAETLSSKQNAARIRAVELLAAARSAEATVEALSVSMEEVVLKVKGELHSAEADAVMVERTVGTVDAEWTVMDTYRKQAEATSIAADNARLGASIEANVSLENRATSLVCIEAADTDLLAERASYEVSMRILADKQKALHELWHTTAVSEAEQAAQLVELARERVDAMGRFSSAESTREQKAVEHVQMVRNHTEVSQAHEQAALAADISTAAVDLRRNTVSTENVTSAARVGHEAADRVNATAHRATAAKTEVRLSAEAVHRAVEESEKASAAAKIAIVECEELGAEGPDFDLAHNATIDERCSAAIASVDASAERVFELTVASKEHSQYISERCGQAVAARVVGDMSVDHTCESALEAAAEAARARAAHEDTVSVAQAALDQCEINVRAARDNVDVARAGTVLAETALITAKEAEAARIAAETAERVRSAAEILAAKQLAARNRVLELVATAEMAENTAERLSSEAETMSLSLDETRLFAEADAGIAENAVIVVAEELVTMEGYRIGAEELSVQAENAQLSACLEANVSEENCESSEVRVRIADDDLATERSKIEEALLRLRGKASGMEERWQAEGVSETVRATQRIPFAQQKADLLSKLSAAETRREQVAVEHVAIVRAHTEVEQAHQHASIASSAATNALHLQSATHSTEKVRNTTHSGHEASVRVTYTSLRATEAKQEVRAAVEAAQRAETEAVDADAAVRAAVKECAEVGVDCPQYHCDRAEHVAVRKTRCEEAIKRVDITSGRVFELNEAATTNSTKATTGCGQAVAARTLGDLAITRAIVASEEATREAARARAAQAETVTFAEDAQTRAAERTKSATLAAESARLAVPEAEAALVAVREAEAARVAAEIAEKARTEAEILAAKQRAAQLRAEELVAAALAAEDHAERSAADAKGISLHLNQTLLSAETDAKIAENAVIVVEEEAVLLETYRTRAEELGIIAEKAKVGASLEANVSEENCEASDRRVRAADGALASERGSVDKSLDHLRARKNTSKEQWQREQTKEAARLSQLSGFAQQRATLLGKLSAAESTREQKALEHVSVVRAHNEVAQAQEQASIATSAADGAVQLQKSFHTAENAKANTHAAQEAAQRVSYTAQRAVAAKAEVRVAVEIATQAAARSVEATAAAKAAIAECEELNCAYPDFHLNRSGAVTPRNLRCSEAINRVDVSAERVFLLQESSKQDSKQATARCSQAVAARTVGDMAVARATHASDEANREAARARNASVVMITFADAALSRCQKGASASSEAWEESRIAAAEAEKTSLAHEEAERQREAQEATERADMAARALFKKQQAALAHMREQTDLARTAEAAAEKWTTAVEAIVLSLDKALESAEEANASASEAAGTAQVEALSFEEYRARTEDTHMVVRNALYATSVETNMSEENCKASQLHIQTSDDVLVAEHASIEEELGLLGEPTLHGQDEESMSLWTTQRATIAHKIATLMAKMLSAAQRREEQAREHVSHVRGRTHASVAKDKAAYATEAAAAATHKKHTARSVETVTKVTHMANLAADKSSASTRRAADAKVELRVAMERSTKAAEMYMLAASSAKAAIKACEDTGASSPRYDRNAVEVVAKHTQRRTDAVRRVNEQADQIFALSKRTQHSTQKATGLCTNALAAKAEGDANVTRSVEGSKEANTVATRARHAEAEMIAAAEAALVRSHEYVRTSRQAVEEARTAASEAETARVAAEAAAVARRNADPRVNSRYELRNTGSQYRFEPHSPETQYSGTSVNTRQTAQPLYTRKESRNTMTMRQAAQERVENLRMIMRDATASAEEWTFTAERVAYSLDQAVLSAEEATDSVRESAGMVDTELAAMKKFLARAEKISATAYDALYATSVETNACEEGKRASTKRINIADGVLQDERASVEEELRLLDETMLGSSSLDTLGESRNVRTAHDMSKLVSRMFAAAVRREKQAMEHVSLARHHSKAEHAHEKAAIASAAASEATRLQQKVSGTERLNRATKACTTAAERANKAAEQAAEAKVEVRVAVEAATKAAEAAMQASRDLLTWKAECEMLGVDFYRGEHNNPDEATWYTKRCNEAVRRVNESADHVTMLRGVTQDSAHQAVAQSRQANSARSEAELTVSRVLDASREASEIAFRARQIESETIAAAEAALVRARKEAKPAREAVIETRTATADVERAHDHAEMVRKSSAEKMEHSRLAREKAQTLVVAARDAESLAEQKSFAAERIAMSLVSVLQQAVDASIVTAEVDERVQEDASAMAAFSSQAQSMLRAAEDARAAVSSYAHDCEENSRAYLNRVQRADEAFSAVRLAIEKELVSLDKTVAVAEQRWEAEGTTDALQSSQRASFAQQRNGLNARLAAAAVIREEKILDILTQAKDHHDVSKAQDKASAATAAASAAESLEKSTRTAEMATQHVSRGNQAADKANAAAQQASEAKAEVLAAVMETERAAVQAAETAAAARQAIAQCDDQDKGAFDEATFIRVDDVVRRTQRCQDATQRVAESANHVGVLSVTARQSLEHAADVLQRAVAARAAGESAIARTVGAAKDATEEANRVSEVESAMIASTEESLARAQESTRSLKRVM